MDREVNEKTQIILSIWAAKRRKDLEQILEKKQTFLRKGRVRPII